MGGDIRFGEKIRTNVKFSLESRETAGQLGLGVENVYRQSGTAPGQWAFQFNAKTFLNLERL